MSTYSVCQHFFFAFGLWRPLLRRWSVPAFPGKARSVPLPGPYQPRGDSGKLPVYDCALLVLEVRCSAVVRGYGVWGGEEKEEEEVHGSARRWSPVGDRSLDRRRVHKALTGTHLDYPAATARRCPNRHPSRSTNRRRAAAAGERHNKTTRRWFASVVSGGTAARVL